MTNPENRHESSPRVVRGIVDMAGVLVGAGALELGNGFVAKSLGFLVMSLSGLDLYRMWQQEESGQQGSNPVE